MNMFECKASDRCTKRECGTASFPMLEKNEHLIDWVKRYFVVVFFLNDALFFLEAYMP